MWVRQLVCEQSSPAGAVFCVQPVPGQDEGGRMKYNKREQEAISALNKIAYAFRHSESTTLSLSEKNALEEVFGIDLKKVSLPKSKVKTWVRGKEEPLVKVAPGRSPGSWYPDTFCFFPFQVKATSFFSGISKMGCLVIRFKFIIFCH